MNSPVERQALTGPDAHREHTVSLRRFHRIAELFPATIRRFVRSREIGLVILATIIGVSSAIVVSIMGGVAEAMHQLLFRLRDGERLSGVPEFDQLFVLFWPMTGGAVLAAMHFWQRGKSGHGIVDPIEANALRGGKMSLSDSTILAVQTLISNGYGASVGLEAGYTQMSSSLASALGGSMRLRREDMRIIVGCGAAGAIAAAFDGPFTGAFYAFELVLAQYAIGYVAPIIAASIAATLTMQALGGAPFSLSIATERGLTAADFPVFVLIGAACACVGIVWMRALPLAERLFVATRTPRAIHPVIGGLLVGGIAIVSPQVLAGGRGALELGLFADLGVAAVLTLAVLKVAAAIISLGSGFRGGLFFSSLLVGALLGRGFAMALALAWPASAPDIAAFSLVGMASLAAAVIGTPLTMSFLVLETTSDYALTGAVLAASVVSNLIVREGFGYSFSTWRFHLSGETIRSARDVSWARELVVDRLMRTDPPTASKNLSVDEFQEVFPLGSHQRVALIDNEGRFCGLVVVAEAHVEGLQDAAPIQSLAGPATEVLLPSMSIKDAMRIFDKTESDVLAVVDDAQAGKLVGTLKESHAIRRYAEEIEKVQNAGF